ncbi:MAG: CAP domain-containing protein [Candidatus Dojkabacteria bacterium]|nr:MAG: CAP domain-containing protein [Candidatus Dojkabacteria bacterium]
MPLQRATYALLVLSYVVTIIVRIGFPFLLASDISSRVLVELANQSRVSQNAPPLKYNKKLEQAAYKKAEDMLKKQYWSHFGPNQESPWQFITAEGYSYAYAGENLAKGFFESDAVHQAWMNSQAHKDNIMDPSFDEVGIAIVKGRLLGSDVFLVVQMFGNTAFRAPEAGNFPRVQITYPEAGDTLASGVFTVRGNGSLLENNQLELLVNDEYLASVNVNDDTFEYNSNAPFSNGTISLTARAVGIHQEYLADKVTFTIENSKRHNGKDLAGCIVINKEVFSVTVEYACSDKDTLADMKVQVASMSFVPQSGEPKISIPLSSLPETFSTFDITLSYRDGESNYFKVQKPDTIQSMPAQIQGISTGQIIIWSSVALTILALAVSIFMMVKKGIFMTHKRQVALVLIGIVFLVGISLIGVVNV